MRAKRIDMLVGVVSLQLASFDHISIYLVVILYNAPIIK